MKMYGENHVVGYTADGREIISQFPQSAEEALKQDICRWEPKPLQLCERHGGGFLVYTLTGLRNCCARNDSSANWLRMRAAGEPMNPSEAEAQGKDHYWRGAIGSQCGHMGKRTIDGKCWYCQAAKRKPEGRSPRQAALLAGETWYQPAAGDVCPSGHDGPRRVANGSCRECEQVAREAAGKAPLVDTGGIVELRDICPDTVISREDARLAGFKYFRNGRECNNGHAGWRYVSTGGCLTCMGRG